MNVARSNPRIIPFFERQQDARRRERLFRLKFILLAVVCTVTTAALITWLPMAWVNVEPGVFTTSNTRQAQNSMPTWLPYLTGVVASSLALLILIWLKRKLLLYASLGLTDVLRGREIDRDSDDPGIRRIFNVLEEMCLASGMPAPALYVWPRYSRINSLAVGRGPADATIFLSAGATGGALTRDELQALLAYSLGQIANGDMALHLRIASYLHAFQVGPRLARSLVDRSTFESGGIFGLLAWFFFFLWVGLALSVLFAPLWFSAKYLQSQIARERQEYADASALQFTRNPEALKSLLEKAGSLGVELSYPPPDFETLAHCFFISPEVLWTPRLRRSLARRMTALGVAPMSTEQVEKLQKQNRVERQESLREAREHAQVEQRAADERTKARRQLITGFMSAIAGQHAGKESRAAAIEVPALPIVAEADVRVAIFALLIDRNATTGRLQLNVLARHYGEGVTPLFMPALEPARNLSVAQRQQALETNLPRLRTLPVNELARMRRVLDEMRSSDTQFDVFDYALTRTVVVFIDDLLNPGEQHGDLTLNDLSSELHLLMVVVASHTASEHAPEAFEAGMRMLGLKSSRRYQPRESWLSAMNVALPKLNCLRLAAKEILLEAVDVVIRFDKFSTLAERELLRAIGATLHCAVPREGAGTAVAPNDAARGPSR